MIDVSTGAILERIDYDEFGNVTADSAPGFQPFAYTGGLYDRDTGLVRHGVRDYDSVTGRWTASDAQRFGGGDSNLFAYVGSDPVNLIDLGGFAAAVASSGNPNPFDCNELLAEIIQTTATLAQRAQELREDPLGLQFNNWDTPGPYGSVVGHQQQFEGWQRRSRQQLKEWEDNKCGGDGMQLPDLAWKLATMPAPRPKWRLSPNAQATAKAVGTAGGTYIIYRVVRMLPSLIPALWPSIPANLAIP